MIKSGRRGAADSEGAPDLIAADSSRPSLAGRKRRELSGRLARSSQYRVNLSRINCSYSTVLVKCACDRACVSDSVAPSHSCIHNLVSTYHLQYHNR